MAAIPPFDVLRAHQADERFVDERSGLESVVGTLTALGSALNSDSLTLAGLHGRVVVVDPVFVFTTTWNSPCSVVESVNCSERV